MTISRRTALTLLASVPIVAAGCARPEERDHLRLFDAVWKTVDDSYYDASALEPSWRQARSFWRPRAARAESRAELYLAVLIPMLERLNASHIQLRPSSTLLMPLNRSLPLPNMRRGDRPVYLTSNDEAGMGASLTWDGERLIVTDVDPDGLAWTGGLRAGDPVYARRFRANDTGGRLALINHRNNAEIVLEWTKRAPKPDLSYEQFAERSAIIRFNAFDKTSVDWLLDKLSTPHDGVVLDLTNNRGGLIVECQRALSALLPPGSDIGMFRTRTGESQSRTATSSMPAADTANLVLLTGMRTLSGGEIFADCIRRTRGAVLVGDRTAGAVLASKRFQLPDGGRLLLPFADYFTPSGDRLEGIGVTPDVPASGLNHAALVEKAKSLAHAA